MVRGTSLRDDLGFGSYVRNAILPFAPPREPIPFRAFVDGADEPMSFAEDLAEDILARPGAIWSVTAPPGFGKSHLGRWVAARLGRQFLSKPDASTVPIWIGPQTLDTIRLFFTLPRAEVPLAVDVVPAVLLRRPEFAAIEPGARARICQEFADLPVVLIIDCDEDPSLKAAVRRPPAGSAIRLLQLSLGEPLGGRVARLAPWDAETRALAASRIRGEEGLRRLNALQASPAAAIASYPLFASRVVERQEVLDDELRRDGGVAEFLRWVHAASSAGATDFLTWCEGLLVEPGRRPALARDVRTLHLGSDRCTDYSRAFLGAILAALVRVGREQGAFRARVYADDEVAAVAGFLSAPGQAVEVPRLRGRDPTEASNRANLRWKLGGSISPREIIAARDHLRVPGYGFGHGLAGIDLADSDLSDVVLVDRRIRHSELFACDLRGADLRRDELRDSFLGSCRLQLADLRGSAFLRCTLDRLDLSTAALGGATFDSCRLRLVTFGSAGTADPIAFRKSSLEACGLRVLESSGLHLERCKVSGSDLSRLQPKDLSAEEATFRRCDLTRLRAAGARLARSTFHECRMGDASLEGADLRGARFVDVDFRQGPGARSGHTEVSARGHPMYGSQTGFYGDDSAVAVWGDPALVRTANLRGTDLAGAVLKRTDLFRVDLRGARMDPEFRDAARRMGAFV